MEKAKIDVAVLFLFFARPEQTAKVFEQIRIARPSKLFLYQDGAREGRVDDVKGVEECRKIVENIDWECDVHRWYQDHNEGCDPSEYLSQKWMFDHVEKGIILEDDDVPSQSFFPFCKELLDKYENDLRISMISGMCHMDKVDIDDDYFFSKHGPIWGWATWKRTIDSWDTTYSFMQDKYVVDTIRYNGDFSITLEKTCKSHLASGKEHYESLLRMYRILNNQLAIIPTKNLISNIGLTANATHCHMTLEDLPPKMRHIYNKKTYTYEFPLKHPSYVVENKILGKAIEETMASHLPEKLFMLRNKIKKAMVLLKTKMKMG